MEWISVKDKLPDEDTGKVLIIYLEPFFGTFNQEIGVGYYDHPDSYEDPSYAKGWRFWMPDREVLGGGVTHWGLCPELPKED